MSYEPVDRLPVLAIEPFEQMAIRRWHGEGLPEGVHPVDYLGMSRLVHVPLNAGPIPAYEQEVIREDEEYVVERFGWGGLVRRRKDNPTMFYGHTDPPVAEPRDWETYRERFLISTQGRLPADWTEVIVPRLNASPDPVGFSFLFFFRLGFYAMGMERFLTAFYEQPDLIHDMFSQWRDLLLALMAEALKVVRVDYLVVCEDWAFKTAPLISPDIYRQFWAPCHGPILQLLREHGVPVLVLGSSGQFDVLLPDLLDVGWNCMGPVELIAGMDATALRKRYGRRMMFIGNIAKEAVIAGPEAIDNEIERLMPLIRSGGIVPAMDDMASPDMPFSHYRYMIERLQSIRLD
jgi:uroporphyrinogen decarboxylase